MPQACLRRRAFRSPAKGSVSAGCSLGEWLGCCPTRSTKVTPPTGSRRNRCNRDFLPVLRAGRSRQGMTRSCPSLPATLTHLASDLAELWSAPASSSTRAPTATFLVAYNLRRAASACTASLFRNARNSGVWPMNSPSAVHALTVATAPPFPASCVGRMIETTGAPASLAGLMTLFTQEK